MESANTPSDLTLILSLVIVVVVAAFILKGISWQDDIDNDPLMRNARARQEAARPPAEIIEEGYAYRIRKRRILLFVVTVLMVAFVVGQHELANQVALALWRLVTAMAEWLLQLVGSVLN